MRCGWARISCDISARVPAHAAINDSVELVKRAQKRSAAPFANAVLRKIAATEVEASKPDCRWHHHSVSRARVRSSRMAG